jgi:hypothetical protein
MRKVLCRKLFNFVLEGGTVILLDNEFMHLAFLLLLLSDQPDHYVPIIDLNPAECVLLDFLILKKVFLMLEP